MSTPIPLDFRTIRQRLEAAALPEVDLVVGIGTGGTVPASLAAYKLDRPLLMMRISYRDADNQPQYPEPVVLQHAALPEGPARILLVDDVSVSGKTMVRALEQFAGHDVTTLVMKGSADIVLFPEITACVAWPWRTPAPQTVPTVGSFEE